MTQILEANCVKDTAICHKANITVPTNQYLRSTQVPDIYDFTVDVPLADPEETEFIFHSGCMTEMTYCTRMLIQYLLI